MVRRGSTVRVRQRASQKASKWPFLLPGRNTASSRATLNLSPRSVPNIRDQTRSWLEHRDRRAQSTSVGGRYSNSVLRGADRYRVIRDVRSDVSQTHAERGSCGRLGRSQAAAPLGWRHERLHVAWAGARPAHGWIGGLDAGRPRSEERGRSVQTDESSQQCSEVAPDKHVEAEEAAPEW